MPLPRPSPGTVRWWVIGSIGIMSGVALAVWFGLSATLGQPSWQTLSYRVVDDQTVQVSFAVHSPGGRALTCRVQALARDFATVGSLQVAFAASSSDESRHTVTLRTTSRAVTGEVRTCT